MLGRVGLGYTVVRCKKCQTDNRVLDSEAEQLKCSKCGTMAQRPKQGWRWVGRPMEAGEFVLTGAPALMQAYGPTAKELKIVFLFDEPENNFDTGYAAYSAAGRLCHGDGEYIQDAYPLEVYAKKDRNGNARNSMRGVAGEVLIKSGVAAQAFRWPGSEFAKGDLVRCPGESADMWPQCEFCAPYGVLRFAMAADTGLFEFGYYKLSTGSNRNYDSISDMLALWYDRTGTVSYVPFWLRVQTEEIRYRDEGTWRTTEHSFVYLQPEETVGAAVYFADAYKNLPAHLVHVTLPQLVPPGMDRGPEPPPLLESPHKAEDDVEELPRPELDEEDIEEGEYVDAEEAPADAPAVARELLEAGTWQDFGALATSYGLADHVGDCFNKLTAVASDSDLKDFRKMSRVQAWLSLGGNVEEKEQTDDDVNASLDVEVFLDGNPAWEEQLELAFKTFPALHGDLATAEQVLKDAIGETWRRSPAKLRWRAWAKYQEPYGDEEDE